MPEPCSFRQVDEKHVAGDVAHMAWSPKMDLLAIATTNGEVLLYRLSMQKVWTLPAPGEDTVVTALAWRPDGKVIAVGYDSDCVQLRDVENADVLHVVVDTSHVVTIDWINEVGAAKTVGGQKTSADGPGEPRCFVEKSTTYLPKLPSLNKSYGALAKGQSEENVEDPKRLKDQTNLNVLIVGSKHGYVQLYAYGLLPLASINVCTSAGIEVETIARATLSADLRLLSVVVESSNHQLHLITYDTSLLAQRSAELCIVAHKYGQISSLLGYLRATLKQMGEAWEDILLEMDTKLIKFAQEKGASSGTVCNDFLELLMFGTPSDELHDFLLRDLTDKGLKKLGHSIETSYTNVQKLVLRQVQSCGQALLYHLGDLCSMAGWEEKFGVLGLDEVCLRAAVARVGSFMLKASELQHVIDDSLKNFKAFFRWLYVAILRLSDEAVPPELTKNTQQMYSFVAEFLDENFTLNETNDEDRSHGFKLERVGQYLKNKPLHNPPCCDDNPWIKFLAENPSIAGSELLYPVERDQSLIQAHDTLEAAIERCMKTPGEVLSMLFRCRAVVTVLESEFVDREQGSHSPKVAQFSVCNETGSYVYTLCMTKPAPVPTVCFFAHNTDSAPDDIQACTFKFTKLGNQDYSTSSAERCKEHKILDIAFYDAKTISVLLLEACDDGLAVLAQAPMAPLRDGTSARLLVETDTVQNVGRSSVSLSSLPCIEMGPHIQQMNCRKLENMKARALAVSGTRKVACVLFASVRRVRLYLMDVEDDDDECNETDADTTAHSGMDDSQQITDKSQNEEDKENTSYTSADTVDTST